MRSLPVLVMLAAAALAGCTDDGSSSGAAGDGDASSDALVIAPTWDIGDSWTFENTGPDGETSVMSLVVTGEEGGDYIIDTNEPTVAYFHAQMDISYLGEVRKSDLAGSQGSDRVRYFDFPLEDGKAWSTSWDGLTVDVEVTDVAGGTVSLAATTGGRAFADYTYSVDDRFMGEIDFYDENGTQAFRMELTDSGSGFSGTVYRYTLHERTVYSISDAGAESQESDWDEDVTEVWFESVADCAQAAAGRVGSTVTTRSPDEPFVSQIIVGTKESQHGVATDCSPGATARAEDTLPIDHGLVYDIEYGVAAEGGSITVTVEPRTLLAIEVGGGG